MSRSFLDPHSELKVDLLSKRCMGICEVGKLLHELYSAYLKAMKVIEEIDDKTWEEITNRR